jgi:hypothetical protein
VKLEKKTVKKHIAFKWGLKFRLSQNLGVSKFHHFYFFLSAFTIAMFTITKKYFESSALDIMVLSPNLDSMNFFHFANSKLWGWNRGQGVKKNTWHWLTLKITQIRENLNILACCLTSSY